VPQVMPWAMVMLKPGSTDQVIELGG
jgi:hypothetical protein